MKRINVLAWLFSVVAALSLCSVAVFADGEAAESETGMAVELMVASDTTDDAVASITKGGTTDYYADLSEALNAAVEAGGGVVVLQRDVTDATVFEPSNRGGGIVTLDLNGCTISGDFLCCPRNGAVQLNVTDSGENGTITKLTLKQGCMTVSDGTVTALTVECVDGSELCGVTVAGGMINTLNVEEGEAYIISGTVTTLNANCSTRETSISGGTVTTLNAKDSSIVFVSGGLVSTLNVERYTGVSLSGGSYGCIRGTEVTLGSILATGKVFANSDGTKPPSTKLGMEGVDMTGYSIVDCDHSCGVNDSGSCAYCRVDLEIVSVTVEGETTWYPTAMAAFEAAKKQTTAVVTLRRGISVNETITLDSGKITLNLAGHSIGNNGCTVFDLRGNAELIVNADGGSIAQAPYNTIVVSENAKLTLVGTEITNETGSDLTIAGGDTTITAGSDIQVSVSISDGKLAVAGGKVTALNVSGGEVSLSGGEFGTIEVSGAYESCFDLLAKDYNFYAMNEDGTKTWYDSPVTTTKLTCVGVGRLPIQSVKVSNALDKTSFTYGESLVLTAECTFASEGVDVQYQWYEVNGDVTELLAGADDAENSITLRPSAGIHTYRVKICSDDYTVTRDITVTVCRAEPKIEISTDAFQKTYDGETFVFPENPKNDKGEIIEGSWHWEKYDEAKHGVLQPALDGITDTALDGESVEKPVNVRDSARWLLIFTPEDTVNYATVTRLVTVVIVKRSVVVSSADVTGEYTGSTLTNGEKSVAVDGMAGEERFTVAFTGGQTSIGSSANSFTLSNGTADMDNYDIVVEPGTLRVALPADTGAQVKEITQNSVSSGDRETLQDALAMVEKYLAMEPTEEERQTLEALQAELNGLLAALDKAENAQELVVVQTGDSSMLVLWMMLPVVALGAIAMLDERKKRE